MQSPKRAILLLAGRGRRLGRLTDTMPKCLIDVAGMTILERTLRTLSECGVSEAILVVGYRSDQIQQFAGSVCSGVEVRYVENERHAETGTAYSLWLASDYLDTEVLLLEGDIVFDSETLTRILDSSSGDSTWAAVPVSPGRDEGILLQSSESGLLSRVKLVRDPGDGEPSLDYKCAGIQLLTAPMARTLALKLDEAVADGHTRLYADLVLGEILNEHPMRLCSLHDSSWAEVDGPDDLLLAERIFEGPRERSVAEAS